MQQATGAVQHKPVPLRTIQYSTFYVGEMLFGIDVMQVQEVLRYQSMTKVPLAPDVVRGLINLRGQIVTALDLRTRMKLPQLKEGELPLNIVVRTDEGVISLLVDQISDVIEVDSSSFEAPPSTISEELKEMIVGLYKLDDRLLLALNVERTLQVVGEQA